MYVDFVVVVFFFSMSSCASDAEITSVSSRPVTAPDCDNFSNNPLSKFDLSEKLFLFCFKISALVNSLMSTLFLIIATIL